MHFFTPFEMACERQINRYAQSRRYFIIPLAYIIMTEMRYMFIYILGTRCQLRDLRRLRVAQYFSQRVAAQKKQLTRYDLQTFRSN
jgi:hypothetical protein